MEACTRVTLFRSGYPVVEQAVLYAWLLKMFSLLMFCCVSRREVLNEKRCHLYRYCSHNGECIVAFLRVNYTVAFITQLPAYSL